MVNKTNVTKVSLVELLVGFTFDFEAISFEIDDNGTVKEIMLHGATNKIGVNPYRKGCKFKSVRIHSGGLITLVSESKTVTRRLSLCLSNYLLPGTGVQGE